MARFAFLAKMALFQTLLILKHVFNVPLTIFPSTTPVINANPILQAALDALITVVY
jgi:hypothetical protein